jgi:Zn-finger nucleic acid-binding protein
MERIAIELVEVDRCRSCGGLWLDNNEDERLKRAGAAAIADTADPAVGRRDQGTIDCPRCHTRMMRMVDPGRPNVTYESCAICYGNFFDAGEFREVAESGALDTFRQWLLPGRR